MANLVLARRVGESLTIDGGRVVVTVVEVRGNLVRLATTAPPDVVVDRTEVHLAKLARRQQRAAPANT